MSTWLWWNQIQVQVGWIALKLKIFCITLTQVLNLLIYKITDQTYILRNLKWSSTLKCWTGRLWVIDQWWGLHVKAFDPGQGKNCLFTQHQRQEQAVLHIFHQVPTAQGLQKDGWCNQLDLLHGKVVSMENPGEKSPAVNRTGPFSQRLLLNVSHWCRNSKPDFMLAESWIWLVEGKVWDHFLTLL